MELAAWDSVACFKLLADEFESMAPGAQPMHGPAARDMLRCLFTDVKTEFAPFTDEALTASLARGQ